MSVQAPLARDADLRAELDQQRKANKALMLDLDNAETELRSYRRENKRLKTELDKARGQHVAEGDANRVFDHWCRRRGKRKGTKFGEVRQRKVKARLREGFTADDLCKAVDGNHRFPYQLYADHVAKPVRGAVLRDDLEYVCQDEAQVERFMGLADRVDEVALAPVRRRRRDRVEKRSGFDLVERLEGIGLGVVNVGPNRWSCQCPAHDDRSPSLSVRECDDGAVLVHCFAGCPTTAVLESIAWEFGHLRPRD